MSNSAGSKAEEAGKKKSKSVVAPTALKKKKGKKTSSKSASPAKQSVVVEEKKAEEEKPAVEAPQDSGEGSKKKKKKAKKKSSGASGSQTSSDSPRGVTFQDDAKAEDDSDDDAEDDIDLWRIQSASKRNKKASDATKRAAANKERERERALKKQEEEEAKKAEEERKAAEEAAKAQAEAEAAAKAAAALEEAKKKKPNGSSSAASAGPTTDGENDDDAAATAGEKKRRKRKKKKPVDNDDGEPKIVAPAPVTHWETVPVVEEWQEVGHKKAKQKAKAASSDDVPALTSEEPSPPNRGGSTIQTLQENSGAKFHLDRTTNMLTITGTEEAVERGLLEARSILAAEAERKANETTEKVTWGSDAIKAVIGKGGANIKATQEATGVKIDADVEAGTLEITGQREKVQDALAMCHNAAFGEAQAVMELGSRNAVNVVYGPNFSTIRGLQDETGCKLDIARGGTTLKLSGSVEAVATAMARVRALLEANRGFEMIIENTKVGAVYGKGGETLRSIQDRTGVQIDVVRGPTHATVSVMGTQEASDRARRMLQRAIDGEVELGPGEVAEEIVLGSATAAVIGRGGSNVTDMEKRHGVKINVRSDEQVARVVGRPEKVAAASKDILAIVTPILEAEKAQKKADEALISGESAWQVNADDDDADGW
ncbi:hypothetical protein HJC23_009894 [Cyclotella cryptica]|uniref:K Homology domain-containing protein n=1 Tax=Cyclotella cryptica TaxID=29204 RepID=A0ABD3QBK7_9STRA